MFISKGREILNDHLYEVKRCSIAVVPTLELLEETVEGTTEVLTEN